MPLDINEYGHWIEDRVFEFNEPLLMGPDMVIRKLDVSQLFTGENDITRENIVEAMIDGALHGAVPEPAEDDELVPVQCPDCRQVGVIPALVQKNPGASLDGPMLLHCPDCRDRARN